MPVLSLPLFLPAQNPIWFPIRIPFPMMRIGSILPYSINGPFKSSLLALFRLAWSNKIQLPLLITVCFMAFDIRLQLEINIFWENNHPRQNGGRHQRAQRNGGLNPEAVRAAVVTAALLQRQRQRQLLQERARQQELAGLLPGGRHNYPSILITEVTDDETSDSNGERGTRENVDADQNQERSRRKRKRNSRASGDSEDDDDDSDEDTEDDSGDDDIDSFRGGDDEDDSGASQNPEFFGDSDGDHDFFDDNNRHGHEGSDDDDSDDSDGGGTPLVVELEIRQRPALKTLTTALSSVFETCSMSLFRTFKNECVPFRKNSTNLFVSQPPMTVSTIVEDPQFAFNHLLVDEVL